MKKLSTVVLTAIIGAASASAQYALPAGAFYRGWIAGAGNYGKALKGTEIITPSGADLVWTADGANSEDKEAVYNWTFTTFENGAWTSMTATGASITAPGNTTTFTVEQSKSSGIETVAAETPVTSEYFDLFGRKLNGKPESGLSIRRDTLANGTTKAVKVIVR